MYTGFSSLPSWAINRFDEMVFTNTHTSIDDDPAHHSEIMNICLTGKPIVISVNPANARFLVSTMGTIMYSAEGKFYIIFGLPTIASLIIVVHGAHLEFTIGNTQI